MACTYRMKDAAGAWQTITGKPAMMAALADGRLDHLLPGKVLPWSYTINDLSKPDIYTSDEKVKSAAKQVIDLQYPSGEMSRGEWKSKVRSGGAAEQVFAVLEERSRAENKAAKNTAKAKKEAGEITAPAGYDLTRENGEIVLRGPWSDDLHARIKRAGGKWEGSEHGTGRVGRKAWIIPEDKASSLKRIFSNVGGALAAEDAGRKAAAQAEAEKAAAAKAEADRKQAEDRAAAPTIAPGTHGPFTVRAVSGGYRVMFAYDSDRVAQIKANGGKKFDPMDRSWFVDAADAGKLLSLMERAKAAVAPAPYSAPASARKPRVLFPLSTMPRMGVPVTWNGRTVVFESKGEPFRINEDHPSLHGSHLLGYEGDRGAYAYYRDATPEESPKVEANKQGMTTKRDAKTPAAAPKFSSAPKPLPDTITVDGAELPTKNSKGQPIHPTEEGIRNFWKWFGRDGLLDEDGRPMLVYHGGGAEFSGIQDKGRFGKAIFVKQGSESGYGDVQHALYLRGDVLSLGDLRRSLRGDEDNEILKAATQKDLSEDDADDLVRALTTDENYPSDEHVWDLIGAIDEADAQLEIQKLRGKVASMLGASAVETPDEFDGDTIMVVDPMAIKSAVGNAGTFAPSSPDIRFSNSPDEPTPAGITYDTLPAAFAKRFPKLEGAVKTMLHRGALGRKGGLVVLDSNDSADIAREFASRTGWDYRETMEMFESVDGAGVHGIYDPKTGTIFAVGPNLDEASLPAVILHEAIHGQQRASVDTKAQALLEGRAKEAPALRAFLDRVAERMEEVGETGNRFEVAPYIVEMAVTEGRKAGFSAADGPILAWIEKNIGRKVADLVRDFVATLRAWALAHGVPLKSVAVDDLVAYAMAGVGRAARGEVVTLGKAVASKATDDRPARAGWTESRIDRLIGEFAYDFDGGRTKAYAAFVNPDDFLSATTPKDEREQLESESKPLDREGLGSQKQPIFLRVRKGSKKGTYQITGHEGRHRMMALRDAGYSRVPVVLIFPDAIEGAESIEEPRFIAQKFGDGTKAAKGFSARSATPITSGNRAELVEEFSSSARGSSDVQFSRSAPLRAATKAAASALNKLSPSGQAALGTLTADQRAAVERVFGKPKTLAERAEAFAKDWKKNLVQGVFDQFAPIKEISSKGYMLARLAKGGDSTLEALMMYGKVSVDGDGVYQVDFDGQNLKGFASTMAKLDGEHDRFLAWVSGQRAERLAGVGLENLMTAQDITALKTLADGSTASGKVRRALYAEALKELNAFNDSVLKIAADSGLIDEATRAMYRDTPYVPFYRLSEEEVVKGPAVSKGLVNQSAWKQLKGGTDKLNEDLMGNLLKNWSHLITASANNRAAKEVLDTAARMGAATDMTNDVVAQDINGQPIYRGNTKGLVRYRGEIKRKIPAGQPYIENGQTLISDGTAEIVYVGDRYFRVDDPHLMDAIASIGFTTKVWKPMADFKRYLTFGVTVNPTFKIRNLIRDSIQAVGTADLSYNPVKNILMGAKGTEMMSNVRAQMLASGGMLRFGSSEGAYSGHVRRLIEKGVDPQYILDNGSKVKAFWKHKVLPAFEAYQELGDRSENVNRAALYEQLLAKGMSHAEASFWARDMMDFSMHGKWAAIRTLTAVVPFMNARLQGIYKLGRATKADYRRMGATLAAVSVASMALMLAYGDDDDWKKREDWDRDNSWWFKIGDTAFRIPKPFEVGAVGTIAERSLELMISDEMTGKRFGQRMRDLLMHNLSMNPTPQLVKPMIDLYANKDGFSGRDIETQGMEKMRPEDRYTARTSEVARFLGQLGLPNPAQLLMGRVEGLSPVQIDHLIRGYFSWVGTSATNVLDRGIRPMMDRGEQPDMRLRDVFLAGNFVESLPSGSSRYVTQFYEQAREVEQMYASYRQAMKEGDAEKAQEIRDENPEGFAARRRIEAAKRAESLISGQMRTIERDRAMTGEEKRVRLDQLEKRRDEIARRALLVPAAAGRD